VQGTSQEQQAYSEVFGEWLVSPSCLYVATERKLAKRNLLSAHKSRFVWQERIGGHDGKRKVFFPCKYDEVVEFVGDKLIQVKIDGKIGFVDKTGNEVIPCKYDQVVSTGGSRQGGMESAFDNGLGIVQMNGKSGLIDKTGKVIVACKYDTITVPIFKIFALRMNNKYSIVDEIGKELTPTKFDRVSQFDMNYFTATLNNEKHTFDRHGNKLNIKVGVARIDNFNLNSNTFNFAELTTGKRLNYRNIVIDGKKVSKTNCVIVQGKYMLEFIPVGSPQTVLFSVYDKVLDYKLANDTLTIMQIR